MYIYGVCIESWWVQFVLMLMKEVSFASLGHYMPNYTIIDTELEGGGDNIAVNM